MKITQLLTDQDPRKFPFSTLEQVPSWFTIDGGESEEDIADSFFSVTGLEPGDLRFEWSDTHNCNKLHWRNRTYLLSFTEEESGNDKTVRALDDIFSTTHQIRLISPSIGTGGFDFVVLAHEEWTKLEAENDLVRKWLIPIRSFPDLFNTPLSSLMEIGNVTV